MSQLFQPFRALGYICDGVPCAVQQRGTETFVASSVGRAYQLYKCDRLSLQFVGPMLEKKIRAIALYKDVTFVASGPQVRAFKRGKETGCMGEADGSQVRLLIVLGDHLVAIAKSGKVDTWDASTCELHASFELGEELGTPTAVAHPPTYLNKVLVGGTTGKMQLCNLRTRKCIYQFEGWGASVTAIEPSPAVDVAAVGLADGRIVMHNLLSDETLFTFSHGVPIHSLSFRCGTPQHGLSSNKMALITSDCGTMRSLSIKLP